jgi:16S rRNA processing protein RimM
MSTFFIAQIGRTVGLWGDLKLHLHTDFPEQFKQGSSFESSLGNLTIKEVNLKRGTIRFVGYEDLESAKKLTNVKLYTTKEQTLTNCELKQGEHFWFEVIGCQLEEDGEVLGVVEEIQRMLTVDYLSIQTSPKLVQEGYAKQFLLPYIDRYILQCNVELQTITTKDAKEILEAS